MVASVAMKGRMPTRLTIAPLKRPPSTPTPSAAATASQIGMPAANSKCGDNARKARHRADGKSKSPMTMTMVMPAATTMSMETCWVMLSQLRAVGKVPGSMTTKKTRMSTKPIRVP